MYRSTHLHSILPSRIRSQRAFTLIELIVVVIVLGILMAVVLPNFFGASNSAKQATAREYLTNAYRAARLVQTQNDGAYPDAATLVSALNLSEPELHFQTSTLDSSATAQTIQVTVTDPNMPGSGVTLRSTAVDGSTCALTDTGGVLAPATCTVSSPDTVPVLVDPPTLSGTTNNKDTLTVTPGSYTGSRSITLGYTWERCNAGGGACISIGSVTGSVYTLADGDVGHTIRAVETAHDALGDLSTPTTASALVSDGIPVLGDPPTLSGTTNDKDMLTVVPGDYSGHQPITLSYVWERCDASGSACTQIAYATDPTYAIVGNDVDFTIRAIETATNADGQLSTQTAASPLVTTGIPVLGDRPTLAGTTRVGDTLTIVPGTYPGGHRPITFAYNWGLCNASGYACNYISGAHGLTYLLTAADLGGTIEALEMASNANGGISTWTPTSALVTGS